MVQLAETVGNREMALLGHRWRFVDLLTLGDVQAVDAEITAYARLAEVIRLPHYQASTAQFRAVRALLAGRFAEGEDLARQAFAMRQRVQPQLAAQAFAMQRFCLCWQQGRLQELEEEMQSLVAQYPGLPV